MSLVAPHKCPNCGSPCYEGFSSIECTSQSCDHYHKQTFIEYSLEMYAERDEPQVELELRAEEEEYELYPVDEDADTNPGIGSLDWVRKLEVELKECMVPFGMLEVRRECNYDGIRVTLYNPPTGIYVSEAFDVASLADKDDWAVVWLENYLMENFPRELQLAWEQKMINLESTFIEQTRDMKAMNIILPLEEKLLRTVRIGDMYAMGVGARPFRCVSIDRAKGRAEFAYQPGY